MFEEDVVGFGTWMDTVEGLDNLMEKQWKTTNPAKSIEFYKHKYDAGEGAMAQRKNRKYGGFDLLYEQNKPPHEQRENHLRWFRRKEESRYHNRASGGSKKGISKYE